MNVWNRLIALALLMLVAGQLSAQSEPLKVGLTPVPPFVVEAENGEWEGISVELWRRVADATGHNYALVPLPFKELLARVESGDIDVAIGALTMTAEREARFDFTHPFFQTGLSIAVPPAPEQGLWASLRALLSWQFVSVIAALGALLLGVGFVLWLFERKRNPEQFGGDPIKGIGASFWWAAVTMTTVGYGDKAPVSFAGRAVALAWMFAGLIMVASFTAAITSSLTVSNLQHQIQGPGDLVSANVATVADTASEAFLRDERIRHQLYPDLTSAMLSVARGETDAVVYDRALMQFRNLQLGKKRLTLLPDIFQQQLYGFALPSGSAIRGRISEQMLAETESASWQDTLRRYLGRK